MSTFRLQPRWDSTCNAETRRFYPTMCKIFDDYFEPSNATSPDRAASRIRELHNRYRAEKPKEDMEGRTYRMNPEETVEDYYTYTFLDLLWYSVFEIATQIPAEDPAQEMLAAFLRCLKDSKDSIQMGNSRDLWKSLPYLGWGARDALGGDEPNGDMNLIAFAARLTRDHTYHFYEWALWVFCDSLADEPLPDSKEFASWAKNLDENIQTAAQWISIAGPTLFSSDEDGDAAGRLWKGRNGCRGCCPERWVLWKERFGVVARNERASEVTRQIASEASREMQEIEDAYEMRMYEVAQF